MRAYEAGRVSRDAIVDQDEIRLQGTCRCGAGGGSGHVGNLAPLVVPVAFYHGAYAVCSCREGGGSIGGGKGEVGLANELHDRGGRQQAEDVFVLSHIDEVDEGSGKDIRSSSDRSSSSANIVLNERIYGSLRLIVREVQGVLILVVEQPDVDRAGCCNVELERQVCDRGHEDLGIEATEYQILVVLNLRDVRVAGYSSEGQDRGSQSLCRNVVLMSLRIRASSVCWPKVHEVRAWSIDSTAWSDCSG